MSKTTAQRPAGSGTVTRDGTAILVDPEHGAGPAPSGGATSAEFRRGRERTEEAEALALIATRPELARAIARQFGIAPTRQPCGFGLTSAQKELLDFIRAFRVAHGVTPSFDEMRRGVGLVSSLEARGHVLRVPRHARSIVLRETAS